MVRDHCLQWIVVAVRGTLSQNDILTDCAVSCVPFLGGLVAPTAAVSYHLECHGARGSASWQRALFLSQSQLEGCASHLRGMCLNLPQLPVSSELNSNEHSELNSIQ